ncbi:MAG TPA: hypothetical protein VGM37_00500 [Armatimonadota bacterium]|jgi:hypothetical protein
MNSNRTVQKPRLGLVGIWCAAAIGALAPLALAPPPPGAHAQVPANAAAQMKMVILGYNELGMHCMNQDFSELCILPPFNTMRATIVDRSGSDPRIVSAGVTVRYSIPGNTHSYDKTNFWDYAQALFGKPFPRDVGLGGTSLSGPMTLNAAGQWEATGVPLTPITDAGKLDPYQKARLVVTQNGVTVGKAQPVIPVSWEISCNLCHTSPGISVAANILRSHDRRHGTSLETQKPVLCAKCHADPALGAAGTAGVPSMSAAMHTAHAPRMTALNLKVACYACHPGIRTQCQRDVHFSKGIDCLSCHGGMLQVGASTRTPWVDEPHCGDCHHVPGHEYEQAGKLFKLSQGHHGVFCTACHSSPHAVAPAVTSADTVQPMNTQGKPGTINLCAVCHKSTPDDPFDHVFSTGD